jgi:hypothetical protein
MIDRTTAHIIEYGQGITNGGDLSVAVSHDADFSLHKVQGSEVQGSGF